MKRLILFILLTGCGSADMRCPNYCETSCNKLAYCDPVYYWSNRDVNDCTNECIESIDQSSASFDTDHSVCKELEQIIIGETCQQYLYNTFGKPVAQRILK